jgi:hypothetical protein
MSRSKAFVRALAGRVEWYGIVQNYALLITNMPKIRNLYRIGGKCPKRKSQKKNDYNGRKRKNRRIFDLQTKH